MKCIVCVFYQFVKKEKDKEEEEEEKSKRMEKIFLVKLKRNE